MYYVLEEGREYVNLPETHLNALSMSEVERIVFVSMCKERNLNRIKFSAWKGNKSFNRPDLKIDEFDAEEFVNRISELIE